MLTDLQRDILIKAAEGIQEGMWCAGEWFTNLLPLNGNFNPNQKTINVDEVFDANGLVNLAVTTEVLQGMYRCAEGELVFRTILLGGNESDYMIVEQAVGEAILETCDKCQKSYERSGLVFDIFTHNDSCMIGLDPFTAGQQWSEIFRSLL